MSGTHVDNRPSRTSAAGSPLARAWIAVALIPVFFVLAMVVGQVLYSMMGYLPERTVPLWVDLVASAGALVVVLIPCAAAVLLGRRTRSAGDRRGLGPLAVGSIAAIGVVVLTLITIASAPHA